MTSDEEQQLREWQGELANAAASPWQPRCIARAFAQQGALFTFTMQTWIDLDLSQSPLLEGRLPDGEDAMQEIADALAAFAHDPEAVTGLEPEEAILICRKMLVAIEQGFSTSLRMKQPNVVGLLDEHDGFGDWLPLLTCLISQVGLSRQEALDCPVGQALALIAADKRNAGWLVGGEPYDARNGRMTNDQCPMTNGEAA